MKIFLSICVDKKNGISKNGEMAWDIKEDMGFFLDQITNSNISKNKKLLVVGRNTYENVKNIKDVEFLIISNTINESTKNNVKILADLNYLKEYLLTFYVDYDIHILGGKNIYEYSFKNFDNINLALSCIDYDYNCDNVIDNLNIYVSKYIDMLTLKKFFVKDHKNNIDVNITFYTVLTNINNKQEQSYLDLLEYVLNNGERRQTRNAITLSVFGKTLEFDLNRFPLLTTKKMFMKGIVEELLFFIRGETDTTKLSEKGVKIWEGNTSREFLDKMGFTDRNVGDMGPMYGYQWRNFFGFDQLKYCINLLKSDPTSRRIIMTSYNPAQAFDGVLFPCHGICIMFYCRKIEENNYNLDIMMTQRSCDLFLGVPFNIASYALFAYILCNYINNSDSIFKYVPGRLIMNLGDAHIYEEHRSQAIRQILRKPIDFPSIQINNNTDIEKYEMNDITLHNYISYPPINAKMVV